MLVGIHQPHYLPWLRYFDKVDTADLFIVLDTVQYSKNGWQNRNRIKSPQGPLLLTVPVHARLGDRIADVTVDNTQPWRRRHLKSIRQNYHRAPFFELVFPRLEAVYTKPWESLASLNFQMLAIFNDLLGITTQIRCASEFDAQGQATDRLVSLVTAVGGTAYLSGSYAVETYLEPERLEREGVSIQLQSWHTPPYPQCSGEFIPDLSIVDLLMHTGDQALSYIRRGGGRLG